MLEKIRVITKLPNSEQSYKGEVRIAFNTFMQKTYKTSQNDIDDFPHNTHVQSTVQYIRNDIRGCATQMTYQMSYTNSDKYTARVLVYSEKTYCQR
jgi:hypothetical protein